MNSEKLSIGVPAHAEGEMLGKCIDSIVSEIEETDFKKENTKVIISLSGVSRFDLNTSKTLEVAKSMKDKYGDLISIGYSDRGKVNAVNDIFERAQSFGNYLIMTDSDVTFGTGSFYEIIDPIVSGSYVLTRSKSVFYGRSSLTKYFEKELKRRNVLKSESGRANHRLVSGPLYAVNLESLNYAFNKSGFIGKGVPRIPTSIICEDQFLAEIMGKTFDSDKMLKCSKATYNHLAFNIENESLLSYWVRGIKGGIQLDRLGFRNAVYRGPEMSGFVPDKSMEIYDFENKLVCNLEIHPLGKGVQKVIPEMISLEDKLRFQKNLQCKARESLDRDLSPEYWEPLNKNLTG